MTAVTIKTKRRFAILAILCIAGLGLMIFGAIALLGTQTTHPQKPSPVISSISVSGVSKKSAVISWVTDKPTWSVVRVYSQGNVLVKLIDEDIPVKEHRIFINGLLPNTIYDFEIVSKYEGDNLTLAKGQQFKTLADDTQVH